MNIAKFMGVIILVGAFCGGNASAYSCQDEGMLNKMQAELEMLLEARNYLLIKLQEVQDRIGEVAESLYGMEYFSDHLPLID